MPLRKSHTLVPIIAALGVAAVPAGAAAACTPAATTQAFAKFGDTADYSLAPGGDFDGDTTGWVLTGGARIQSGGS